MFHMEGLYNEIRTSLEKHYQIQSETQQLEIFKNIAILLQPNYPKIPNESDADHIMRIISIIEDRLKDKTPKKGRPKKINPWHHLLLC